MSKAHVRELLKARKLIKSGREVYICDALRIPYRKRIASDLPWNPIAWEVVLQIGQDLEHRYSLVDWLWAKGYYEANNSNLDATRLAWIDALIEYWKDKP